MVFDRVQLEKTLGRALELEADASEAFDAATVRRLADELGISRAAVDRALGETLGPEEGLLNAVAQATIPAPPDAVTRATDAFFRLRGLTTDGSMVWRQDGGWWPDLYRFTATTPVAVAVAPADDGTVVRLTARLDRIWRAHLIAGLLAPLLLVLGLLTGSGPASLPGSVLLATAWAGAAAWAYCARRRAIGRRLAGALQSISLPAYRLAPW